MDKGLIHENVQLLKLWNKNRNKVSSLGQNKAIKLRRFLTYAWNYHCPDFRCTYVFAGSL